MMKVQAKRLSKLTLFVVMTIALALILGVMFTSIPFGKDGVAYAAMSKPNGGYNTNYTWDNSAMINYSTQSGMTTISSTKFTANGITDYSGADDHSRSGSSFTGTGFSSNGWAYDKLPAGSEKLYHPAFFHTFKLTDEVYESITNGYATVSLQKGGNLSFS